MGKFLALFAISSVLISSCGSSSQDFLSNTGSDNDKSSAKANSISDLPASSENRATKEPSDVVDPKQDALHAQASAAAKTNPDALYCPTGSWYSPSEKLCVTQSQAVGPFTRTMIALCKKYGGGEASCETSRWERGFAARLRLRETCPRGAVFDDTRQACVEGNEVYGPFRLREVDACRTRGGGATCETMRWNVSFMPQQIRGGAANRKLLSFYGVRSNYDDVFEEVLSFYPAGRRNGCVAFMSTALRRAGTTVPLSGYINGESVSLVTKPFSQYLQERLGWIKINSANNLQPGDVVLTEDDARYPGYPAHTYMFYGWSNQRAGIGWVIDNQDFIHERNIFGYGTYNFTPFAYALRSPE